MKTINNNILRAKENVQRKQEMRIECAGGNLHLMDRAKYNNNVVYLLQIYVYNSPNQK